MVDGKYPIWIPRAGRTPTAMVFRSSAGNSSQGQIRNTSRPPARAIVHIFSPLLPKGYLGGTKPLLITEGEKKADSLTAHGFPCVGLTGVWGWVDRRGEESAHIPELLEINRHRPISIVFDSDVVIKPRSSMLCGLWLGGSVGENLDLTIHGTGDVPNVVFIPSELNGEKNGADDFIVRHGADAFRSIAALGSASLDWKGSKATRGSFGHRKPTTRTTSLRLSSSC